MALTLGPVKFKAAPFLIKGSINKEGERLFIEFPFNGTIKDEIKAMDGCRWHGYDEPRPRKIWSVRDCPRNRFQLEYLTGGDPYVWYNLPLVDAEPKRKVLYKHQVTLFRDFLTRRHHIAAAEMGAGKTLAAIEAMEWAQSRGWDQWLWVGTGSSIASVKREFWKWNATCWPEFINYDSLKKLLAQWPSGRLPFRGVVFDESSKIKNATAQRSQAALYLADNMRAAYGRECFIILMSGSPAPKDPSNWWHQCEVACPGFLKEGNVMKFKQRLALIQDRDGFDGGTYKALVTWWDNEKKCATCGQFEKEPCPACLATPNQDCPSCKNTRLILHQNHDPINMIEPWFHRWQSSFNEVGLLYRRMTGLVEVMFKKDLLDLPEKQYRRFICKPTQSILNSAKIIQAASETTVKANTLLRELSDGFQYQDVEIGVEQCPACNGTKVEDQFFDLDRPDELLDRLSIEKGKRVIYNDEGEQIGIGDKPLKIGTRKIPCNRCGGSGTAPRLERRTVQVPCPKEDALCELLDEYEEEGRVVIFAGFTGSIERVTTVCARKGWHVIRVDGRGWWSMIPGSSVELLRVFDEEKEKFEKIAFVGQPGAAGMGLNLTASSTIIYYSNSFNGEDRQQSEDRIHRPGADFNRGCTIWDLIHLPSDQWVLDNLKKKRELQGLSLGLMREELANIKIGDERTV